MSFSSVQTANLTAQRILTNNLAATDRSAGRIATARKINRAADGAAELQQIEQLTKAIRGSQAVFDGVQTSNNVLNIADGALNSSSDLLQRARELSVQAANDTLNSDQRAAIQTELNGITEQLDQIAGTTAFNGRRLLDGSTTSFNVTTDSDGGSIDIGNAFSDVSAGSLGLGAIDVSTTAGAQAAINSFDTAINTIGAQRSFIGATQNRLEATGDNLSISIENQSATRARFRDSDFASEVTQLVSSQIRSQSAASILAQTNRFSGDLMSLFS
jgi:flagellin